MFENLVDRRNTSSAKWDETIMNVGIEDVVPLTVADMDFKASPEIVSSMVEAANHGIYGYTIVDESYIDSILHWVRNNHNWYPEKDWYVYCPRIIQAISMIIQNFSEENDKIMIQTPLYDPIQESIGINGRKLISSDLILKDEHYEIDFIDFESKLKDGVKVFICVSPHNPTGRVWKKWELEKIVNLCKKYGVLIISDEVHADFIWKGSFVSFGEFLDTYDRIVICNSPSKTFNIPGLEASSIFIKNKDIREKFVEIINKTGIHNPNYFSVFAVKAAYNDSYDWYRLLKETIKNNISYVKDFFDSLDGFEVTKSEGTFLLWIDYRKSGLSEDDMEEIFKKSKVLFSLGSGYGDTGRGFIRINVASPRTLLEEALESFKEQVLLEGFYEKKES